MARLLKCSAAVLSACLALAATVSADVRAADDGWSPRYR